MCNAHCAYRIISLQLQCVRKITIILKAPKRADLRRSKNQGMLKLRKTFWAQFDRLCPIFSKDLPLISVFIYQQKV